MSVDSHKERTIIFNVKNEAVSNSANLQSPQFLSKLIIANKEQLAIDTFYLIMHDRDTLEDGTSKTLHFHLVVKNSAKKGFKTQLQAYEEVFGDYYIMQIEHINSLKSMVRYLIHYDDSEKYQYQEEEIISNDKNLHRFFVEIEEALNECKTVRELMDTAGVELASRYRMIFRDIKEEQRYDLKSVLQQNQILDSKVGELEEKIAKYEKTFKELNELAVLNNYTELINYLNKKKL